MFESSTRWHRRCCLSRSQVVSVWRREPRVQVYSTVQCTVYSAQNRFCAQQKLSADGGGSPAPGLGPTGGLALHPGSPGTRGGDEWSGAVYLESFAFE